MMQRLLDWNVRVLLVNVVPFDPTGSHGRVAKSLAASARSLGVPVLSLEYEENTTLWRDPTQLNGLGHAVVGERAVKLFRGMPPPARRRSTSAGAPRADRRRPMDRGSVALPPPGPRPSPPPRAFRCVEPSSPMPSQTPGTGRKLVAAASRRLRGRCCRSWPRSCRSATARATSTRTRTWRRLRGGRVMLCLLCARAKRSLLWWLWIMSGGWLCVAAVGWLCAFLLQYFPLHRGGQPQGPTAHRPREPRPAISDPRAANKWRKSRDEWTWKRGFQVRVISGLSGLVTSRRSMRL